MTISRIADITQFQKREDSIFSTLITRKLSRVLTFYLLRWFPNIHPNTVSAISLVLTLAAAVCFLFPQWSWRLLGVLLLQIGFVFDCSDGEVARATGRMSAYGGFLDSVFDRFKEAVILTSITIELVLHYSNAYTSVGKPGIAFTGLAALIGLQLVAFVREAKKASFPTQRKSEIFITERIYLGTVDIFIFAVSVAVIARIEFLMLAAFALVSLPLLIKQLVSAHRLATSNNG